MAHYAFASGVDEIFAVVRPRNARGAATARRVGMEWVGETDKYYALTLQVYRLRRATCTCRDPPASDTAPGGVVRRVAAQPRALNAESAAAIRAARSGLVCFERSNPGVAALWDVTRYRHLHPLGGLVIDARFRAARSIRSAPHAGKGRRRRPGGGWITASPSLPRTPTRRRCIVITARGAAGDLGVGVADPLQA